jgi:hypothetical protein
MSSQGVQDKNPPVLTMDDGWDAILFNGESCISLHCCVMDESESQNQYVRARVDVVGPHFHATNQPTNQPKQIRDDDLGFITNTLSRR